MTGPSRRLAALTALVVVLVFAGAFLARKASSGGTKARPLPTPATLSSTPVHVSGVALPAVALPALRRPPRVTAPAPSTSSSPTQSSTPTPAAPPSGGGGGKSSGPVLIG